MDYFQRNIISSMIVALSFIIIFGAGTAWAKKPRFTDNGNGTLTDSKTGLQ